MPKSNKPAANDAAAGRASVQCLVPQYNVNGNQHHRVPFRDLSHVKDVKKLAQFEKQPHFKTRTEMLEARQVSNMPHISYDCDGDGVVGSQDFVIAKYFDTDHKGSLTKEESKAMKDAVANGFVNNFMWGLEQSGAKRPFAVVQKRGKILSIDNGDDIGTFSNLKNNEISLHFLSKLYNLNVFKRMHFRSFTSTKYL